MKWEDWLLTAKERGNAATRIDARHSDQHPWTEGNRALPLVDGQSYFSRLAEELDTLEAGDELRFTDWRGDRDELMAPAGRRIGEVLASLARGGVDVRGLMWRSHSEALTFNAAANAGLASEIEDAGGEVLLDERVRRGGSHHQKVVVLRHPDHPSRDVAFVGGIDLAHGRRDDQDHAGDPQSLSLDSHYGEQPPWHDLQVEIRGPAVGDLDFTFRERWEDPNPLDFRNASQRIFSRGQLRRMPGNPLPPELADPPACGSNTVQVLRTYPPRRPQYPFAPNGERSIPHAFMKAVARARRLIYIEDQYFWSADAARVLASALASNPELLLIAVVPRYPERDGAMTGLPSRYAQYRAVQMLREAGGDRVALYDLENESGVPIYAHAKTCIIDDVWVTVGSDNLNRRSWTHDSETACAIIDGQLDERAPADPGGLGDGARVFARRLRMALWTEHLGVPSDEPDLLDAAAGFELWRETATTLTAWHKGGRKGPRPRGHVRSHESLPVALVHRGWSNLSYRLLYDPDARPMRLKRARRF